jgi:phosphatidyl-myo-inositol dimannoside synthase
MPVGQQGCNAIAWTTHAVRQALKIRKKPIVNVPRSVPKILMITRNFPPLLGGMERFLYHVYMELCDDFHVALVGPTGCENYLRTESTALSCPVLPPALFLAHCQWQAYRLARSFRPDLIVSGSGLTAPAARLAGLSSKAPVICFLYGLDIVVSNPFYQWLFLPVIRTCTRFLAISQNTKRLAVQAGIDSSRMNILHPGVAIPRSIDRIAGRGFRQGIGAGSRPILLSVGRLTRRKGIVEFVDRALPEIVRQCPEILFVIIGHEPSQALTGTSGITSQIREMARSRNVLGNIVFLGRVDDDLLWAAYSTSQVFVFPVIEQPGDVEGFGMVAVEAAAHGLATVAFAVGGVVDAINEGVSGYLVEPGDYQGFAMRVLEHLQTSKPLATTQSCMDFANCFSWDRFGDQLREICRSLMLDPGPSGCCRSARQTRVQAEPHHDPNLQEGLDTNGTVVRTATVR